MRHKYLKSLAFAGLVALLFSMGCSREEAQTNSAPKKRTFAVIPKGTTHEFWKSIHAGAIKAAQEFDVDIIWKGPLKEDNREEQIQVVEDFISRQVDGIALAPLDDTALRVPVHNATQAGVPVVIIDSGIQSDDYVSFVATDNYLGGKLAADHLAHLLNGKGKVLLLRYAEGSNSTMNREQGFLDALKNYKDITLVSGNQYAGVTTESAYSASENVLAPLKGANGTLAVDGIFCSCEPTTFGMLRALQDAGLAGKVHFVGFDAAQKLVEALKKGELSALLVQNPMRMGYLGVKALVDYHGGKLPEKRIDTGVTLVTKENISDANVKELIEPDLKRWLKE